MPSIETVIAVVGPTAVGKSSVAEGVAVALGGEIVSADSMQVYCGLDIGTAKTPGALRSVPYHCVDLTLPGQPYSAALYQRDARAAIDDIISRSRTPVVVGGTGLYVRAALDEMSFPSGDTDGHARRRYETLAQDMGAAALHDMLQARDPASAGLIHPNNVRRVVRALEMADEGISYAQQAAGFKVRRAVYSTLFIGMTMDRDALYRRIEARVDAMLDEGLQEEVRVLLAEGYREALTASQAIGYKELVPVLEGECRLDEAVALMKQATRRYAKRQLTWFRGDPRIKWLDVTGMSSQEATAAALELIESSGPIAANAADE